MKDGLLYNKDDDDEVKYYERLEHTHKNEMKRRNV